MFMSGTVREGEKGYHAESCLSLKRLPVLLKQFQRDGIMGTAFADKNQYGPVGMMIMLFVVAGITSAVLAIL